MKTDLYAITHLLSIIFLFLFLIPLNSCRSLEYSTGLERRFYGPYKVQGSFLMQELHSKKTIAINVERTTEGFLPASTFKIINTLIFLEEGIARDADHRLKWDGKKRGYTPWNRDHSLASAFKHSVVWYYQRMARRVGVTRMRAYLKKFAYGNGDLTSGIDQFWLKGGFRVSQVETLELLRKIYTEELPVSRRSIQILKRIMLMKTGQGYKLYAKTGMTYQGEHTIGWYVGFIEKQDRLYLFVNNIEAKRPGPEFISARIESAHNILKHYGILE